MFIGDYYWLKSNWMPYVVKAQVNKIQIYIFNYFLQIIRVYYGFGADIASVFYYLR